MPIFGGRLRTASPEEFAFVVFGSTQIDISGRGGKALYHQGVIDKREYYENRFRIL
jgi:hypothetical protein